MTMLSLALSIPKILRCCALLQRQEMYSFSKQMVWMMFSYIDQSAHSSFQMMPVLTIWSGIQEMTQSSLVATTVWFIKSEDQRQMRLTQVILISGRTFPSKIGKSRSWSSRCKRIRRRMKPRRKRKEEWDLEVSFLQKKTSQRKFGSLKLSDPSCLLLLMMALSNSSFLLKVNSMVSSIFVKWTNKDQWKPSKSQTESKLHSWVYQQRPAVILSQLVMIMV